MEKRWPLLLTRRKSERRKLARRSVAESLLDRAVTARRGRYFLLTEGASRTLPLARRRARILRPPGDFMRARNPWVRARRILLG